MSSSTSQPVQGPWTVIYSNAGIDPSNATYYSDDQVVHWLANLGLPLVNTTLGAIDASVWYNTAVAINFSCQAGACGAMFFVVLILSQKAKRRTPIFILNVLSLLFGFCRALFTALYAISPWVKLYPYFTNDFTLIPTSAYANSVVAVVFDVFMTTTVNLSLVLQAYTVTKNMTDVYRYILLVTSSLVFFLAVGFQFADMVINSIAIVQAKYYSAQWVQHGTLYSVTISVWYFSAIFTSKLVYTLHYRRKNGWTQWSGVRILAAMGGCTMIIPSLFAILEYVDDDIATAFPSAGSLTITTVALLLPLSALWASMAIHEETAQLDISGLHGNGNRSHTVLGSHGSGSSTASSCALCPHCRDKKFGPAIRHKEYTDVEMGESASNILFSPNTIKSEVNSNGALKTNNRDSTEMDLESMGVRVDRSYSLQSVKEERTKSRN
ncbi:hypothetical protein D0Z07_0232 [Hyphodiscus hymeniophilus]|uniref:Pheromone receptor n=1 Tax=Hyphodiscus hymeniophilus TaxID=353542 RepID=A0A9P6VQN2_9HELO|nr:hypothetical protein D0Z07_0232 [Hyphodiscus hymeniophilus]